MKNGEGWNEFYTCDKCTAPIGRDTGKYYYEVEGDESVNGHDYDEVPVRKDLCGRCARKAIKHMDGFFK